MSHQQKKHNNKNNNNNNAKKRGRDDSDNNNNNNNNNNKSVDNNPPATVNYVQIDGSILEGGGQILRNSFSLSALLNKPIEITQIRAGRDKPGLKTQHLKGIELINEIYQGKLYGAGPNSMAVSFIPNKFRNQTRFEVDTKTAGSVCLLVQVSLPCLIFGPKPMNVTLKGGTNATAAPPIDYLMHVFKPYSLRFGIDFDIQLETRGYYPRGGGVLHLTTAPMKSLLPVTIVERGKVVEVTAHAFTAGKVPKSVSSRMVAAAKAVIGDVLTEGVTFTEAITDETSHSNGDGTMIQIIARTDKGCLIAANAIGERGVTAEQVGTACGAQFVKNVLAGGCVDEHMQDQLIIFMALANGKSVVKTGPLEMHTKTSIHFAQILTGAKFTVEATPADKRELETEDTYLITCEGIAYTNPN